MDSGTIPVIKLDIDSGKFYRVTETGDWLDLAICTNHKQSPFPHMGYYIELITFT